MAEKPNIDKKWLKAHADKDPGTGRPRFQEEFIRFANSTFSNDVSRIWPHDLRQAVLTDLLAAVEPSTLKPTNHATYRNMKRFVQNDGSYKEELIWSNLFRIGADTSNKFKDSPKKNLLDKMAEVISDTRKGLPVRLATLEPMLLDQRIIHYNRTQQMILVDDFGNQVARSTAAINTPAPEPAAPEANNSTQPGTEDSSQASHQEVSDSSSSRKRFRAVEEERPLQKKPKHTRPNYDADNEQFSDFNFNSRNSRSTTNRNIASRSLYGQRIASSNMASYGTTTTFHNSPWRSPALATNTHRSDDDQAFATTSRGDQSPLRGFLRDNPNMLSRGPRLPIKASLNGHHSLAERDLRQETLSLPQHQANIDRRAEHDSITEHDAAAFSQQLITDPYNRSGQIWRPATENTESTRSNLYEAHFTPQQRAEIHAEHRHYLSGLDTLYDRLLAQEALMLDFFMDLGYDPRPRMRNQAPRY